jgi:hypothetical protein
VTSSLRQGAPQPRRRAVLGALGAIGALALADCAPAAAPRPTPEAVLAELLWRHQWADLDPSLGWEVVTLGSGGGRRAVARERRLTTGSVPESGALARTSEDPGWAVAVGGFDWDRLVVVHAAVGWTTYGYHTSHLTLGKTQVEGFGPLTHKGLGFMHVLGATRMGLFGVAHDGARQVEVPLGVQATDAVVHMVTAIGYGDGSAEWLVNGVSRARVGSGAPTGAMDRPGAAVVQVEVTNDEAAETQFSFHNIKVFVEHRGASGSGTLTPSPVGSGGTSSLYFPRV